jgi:hypothetical protein
MYNLVVFPAFKMEKQHNWGKKIVESYILILEEKFEPEGKLGSQQIFSVKG